MNTIDLHIHSYISDDGQYTEKELVDKAFKAGVKVMSITDHNSIRANKKGREYALEKRITYINGIEIDCIYNGINLHVLGLDINDNLKVFKDIEKEIHTQELSASLKRLELTKKLGFDIKKDDINILSENGIYTGEMFGELLLNDSRYNDNEILKPYRLNGLRSDNPFVNFYWDLYSMGKPCYAKVKFRSLKEIIDVIHQAHGFAIIAHPGNNLAGKFELIDEMIELGLDGIEAYSSYHDKKTCEFFKNKAV
jgi:hypothetical protein